MKGLAYSWTNIVTCLWAQRITLLNKLTTCLMACYSSLSVMLNVGKCWGCFALKTVNVTYMYKRLLYTVTNISSRSVCNILVTFESWQLYFLHHTNVQVTRLNYYYHQYNNTPLLWVVRCLHNNAMSGLKRNVSPSPAPAEISQLSHDSLLTPNIRCSF